MTSSIPDSFNMDELEKALENAPQDIVDRPVDKKYVHKKRLNLLLRKLLIGLLSSTLTFVQGHDDDHCDEDIEWHPHWYQVY